MIFKNADPECMPLLESQRKNSPEQDDDTSMWYTPTAAWRIGVDVALYILAFCLVMAPAIYKIYHSDAPHLSISTLQSIPFQTLQPIPDPKFTNTVVTYFHPLHEDELVYAKTLLSLQDPIVIFTSVKRLHCYTACAPTANCTAPSS
jgi:hypothetical protein